MKFTSTPCLRLFPLALAAIWASLPSASTAQPVYVEKDGLIAFEVEDVPETGSWKFMTEHEGYSGSGYYLWDGSNHFNNGGVGTLTYRLMIENPGDYSLIIHNFHDFPEASEENDVWVRFNEGRWFKVYNHTVNSWNWRTDPEGAYRFPGWNFLQPGENTIELSGRSHGFSVDRIHLYLPELVPHIEAQTLDVELTPRSLNAEALTARFVGAPNRGYAPMTVDFGTEMVVLPEGRSIQSAVWTFGDKGARSQRQTAQFTYDLPGRYTAKLVVTDDTGATAEVESEIHLLPGTSGSLHIHEVTASGHYGGDRPSKILDESSKTRWSNQNIGSWIQFDLGGIFPVDNIILSFFRGDERVYTFDVLTSIDGTTFTPVFLDKKTSGTSEEFTFFAIEEQPARYIRIVGKGNDVNEFTQITRARIGGDYTRQHWWGNAEQTDIWLFQEAFGFFSLADFPWLYHTDHSWIFSSNINAESAYMYDLIPAVWTYFDTTLYPTIFDFSSGEWKRVYVASDGQRWIYNFSDDSWNLL